MTNLSFIFDYITFVPSDTPPSIDCGTIQPTDSLANQCRRDCRGYCGGLVLILLVILIFGAAQKTPTRQKSSFLPPTLGTHNRTYVHSVSHPGRDAVREIIPYRIIGRSRKRGGEDSMNFDKLDSDIGSGLQVKTVAR